MSCQSTSMGIYRSNHITIISAQGYCRLVIIPSCCCNEQQEARDCGLKFFHRECDHCFGIKVQRVTRHASHFRGIYSQHVPPAKPSVQLISRYRATLVVNMGSSSKDVQTVNWILSDILEGLKNSQYSHAGRK